MRFDNCVIFCLQLKADYPVREHRGSLPFSALIILITFYPYLTMW